MRAWLWIAAALVLVVSASSAALRLSQAGVGCTPWPACYAAALAPQPADAVMPAWHETVRLTHRISATAVGLVFVFIVLFGWSRWRAGERVAGVLLLAISLGLAWLGRHTPSALPAVAVGNLLGGHLLLAALAWLIAAPQAPHASFPSSRANRSAPWCFALLAAALAMHSALGALVGTAGAPYPLAMAVGHSLLAALMLALAVALWRRAAA
jgi:cytochrome c oxidase assembly protein subunit 15